MFLYFIHNNLVLLSLTHLLMISKFNRPLQNKLLSCKAGLLWAIPQQVFAIIACSTPAIVELKVKLVSGLLQQNMSLQNKPLHHCLMNIHCIETSEMASQAFKILMEKISLECSIKMASLVFFQETLLIKWSWISL